MDISDFVIVGGVACGPKTAATLARRLPNASIILFQKESRLSYGNCGLPYYASGDIGSFEELTFTSYGVPRDKDYFDKTKGFRAMTGHEVIAINRELRTVTVKDLESGESFEHGYGKLVLATGAGTNRPPFEVPDTTTTSRVRPFTRPDDAIAFRKMAEKGQIGTALVVGGGFIGCEVAEAAGGLWGIEVTLIEKENQILPYVLDPEMVAIAERELARQNVDVQTGATIEKIELNDSGNPVVSIAGGDKITTDYVFLCLGVYPETTLAAACGLRLGPTGGIAVNSRLQTSDENIYAGGDCIESQHQLTKRPVFLPMGSLANRHGRVIAENLAGNETEFPGVLGTFLVKIFDINVGATGLSEQAVRKAGLEPNVIWGTFPDKPDYYPEYQTFVLKMVYDASNNRLLGLQAAGAGDIFRRIDVFASFLGRKARVNDLFEFEHGYAPPFSEALDPLHHLAAMAQAQQRGIKFLNLATDLSETDAQIIDVREPDEFKGEPFEGLSEVINIPLNDLRERSADLDISKKTVVICKRGPRSYQAAMILKAVGFEDVSILSGGLQSRL
ncbi:MAG: FAD-dependent oxidoreductase [candidate division Zixibacteria bacterium]|nr:FAD-dependent oxidoreductase [candidate division Zixibacteria bacterium]